MKSKYGTEISKEDYREIMLLSKEINALNEEHYIKEIRPEPVHPIKRMRNMSGQKSVNLYKSMLRSMLFEEQDNPGRRFENWKQQMVEMIAPLDEGIAEAFEEFTQYDYEELKKIDPDLVVIKFYYNVIVTKDKDTGALKSTDNTKNMEEQREDIVSFLKRKGYLKKDYKVDFSRKEEQE